MDHQRRIDPPYVFKVTPGLERIQARMREYAHERSELFPHAQDASEIVLEVAATRAFKEAVNLCKGCIAKEAVNGMLLKGPSGKRGTLLAELAPDWDLVAFAAMLLRYIALSVMYEVRVFDKDTRLRRDLREVRHKDMLDKWEVIGFA